MRLEGYGRLLREHPAYRRLLLGELVSYLGDWFNLIAVYTSVRALSDSASALTAVMVAKTLPSFFVSPVVGPIVDRFDRRTILILSDIGRIAALLGLLAAHHAGSLGGVFLSLVLMVAISGFVMPARNAVLPQLLPAELLSRANALGAGSWSVMLAVGAALGGAATAALGVTAALVVDLSTFAISLLLFWRLPRLPARSREESSRPAPLSEALQYLWRTPEVLRLAATKPLMGLSTGVVGLIPIAADELGPDTGAFVTGWLFSARGLGALLGTLGVRGLVPDEPQAMKRALAAGFFATGFGWTLVSMALHFDLGAPLAVLGFLVSATGSGAIWVFSSTLLQTTAERSLHGRVFAIEFGLMTLIFAIVSWLSGALVDGGLSPAAVFLLGGCAAGLGLFTWSSAMTGEREAA